MGIYRRSRTHKKNKEVHRRSRTRSRVKDLDQVHEELAKVREGKVSIDHFDSIKVLKSTPYTLEEAEAAGGINSNKFYTKNTMQL